MHTRDLKFRRLFAFIFKFKPHHESILCYNSLKRHSSCQISVLELQFVSKTFQSKLQLQFQGHFQGRLQVQSFLVWTLNPLSIRKTATQLLRLSCTYKLLSVTRDKKCEISARGTLFLMTPFPYRAYIQYSSLLIFKNLPFCQS